MTCGDNAVKEGIAGCECIQERHQGQGGIGQVSRAMKRSLEERQKAIFQQLKQTCNKEWPILAFLGPPKALQGCKLGLGREMSGQ